VSILPAHNNNNNDRLSWSIMGDAWPADVAMIAVWLQYRFSIYCYDWGCAGLDLGLHTTIMARKGWQVISSKMAIL